MKRDKWKSFLPNEAHKNANANQSKMLVNFWSPLLVINRCDGEKRERKKFRPTWKRPICFTDPLPNFHSCRLHLVLENNIMSKITNLILVIVINRKMNLIKWRLSNISSPYKKALWLHCHCMCLLLQWGPPSWKQLLANPCCLCWFNRELPKNIHKGKVSTPTTSTQSWNL